MKKLTLKELDNLNKIYLNAREQLLDNIINYQGVGTKTYYNSIYEALKEHIKKLEKETNKVIWSAIPREYEEGLKTTYEYFTKNNLLMKRPSMFSQIHYDAIYTLAREMQYHIGEGLEQVGRQILRYLDESRDNALRRAGLEASAEKIASGTTIVDMKNNMIKKLQAEGFMTVQYGSGSRAYQVPLDVYTMLCARSTTREAGNIARENLLIENGYDLVKMTTHYPTCAICSQYQGRVYSISGKDKRFPALMKTAFKTGYHNVHPNCRHSIHPWIESLQTEEEIQEAIRKSNAPFKDLRPDEEIKLYNRQQRQNHQMRQDRYQYERYKARLGEDSPKSFSAFRRLKKSGGDSWGILEAQYKGMGYYEKAIKNEPKITKVIIDTAKQVGMKTEGLEFRIKSKESYLRKIKSNYNPKGNVYEIKDVIRYTYTAEADDLAEKTLKSIEYLKNKSYNTINVKNYWLDDTNPYKGINTFVKSPNGQIFELQYHTPESFELKNGKLHELYEKARVIEDDTSEEYIKLQEEMFKLSDNLVKPPKIDEVK